MEQANRELNNAIKRLATCIGISILCGIIGLFVYKYLLDMNTQEELYKGIFVGICAPWGFIVVNLIWHEFDDLWNLLYLCSFGILWFVGLALRIYLSVLVGKYVLPIALIVMCILVIKADVNVHKLNKEVLQGKNINVYKPKVIPSKTTAVALLPKISNDEEKDNKDNDSNDIETECCCDICGTKISEDEYEKNFGLCGMCAYEEGYMVGLEEVKYL